MLMRKLKEIDPERQQDERVQAAAPEYLLEKILSGDHGEGSPSARWSPPRRRFLLAPVVGAAVLALALVLGLPSGGGSNNEVAVELGSVAQAAASDSLPPSTAPYRFLKTRSLAVNTTVADGQSWSVYDSQLTTAWAAADGSGRQRVVKEPPEFVGPGDRAAWEKAGEPNFLANGFNGATEDREVPAGTLGDAGIADLPTEPSALLDQLRQEAEKGSNSAPLPARILDRVAELLRDPTATPQLRAALYEVAADIPGIEYLGSVRDPIGREGDAVGVTSAYSGGETRYSLVYDPTTSEVLATEDKLLEPVAYADATPPLLVSATVYLESAGVDSLSATP